MCASARTVFRPISSDVVGIDGILELVEECFATGVIGGVQIKSGESFVDDTGTRFTFKSDRDHFGYWARCSIPVIGVVFSPDHGKSVWFDLTGLSTDARIANGPYSITVQYSDRTAFTPASLTSQIYPVIRQYAHQRRSLRQVQTLIQAKSQKASLSVPTIEVSNEKEEAWHELIETVFGIRSTDEEVADAGYRLSWHFPAVSEKLQQTLKDSFSQIDDFLLVRVLRVIHDLIEDNAAPAAELIADLLRYVPEISARIEELLKEHKIASAHAEGAIQIIELLDQQNRDDLRSLVQE